MRNGLRSGTFLVVFYTLSCYSDSPFFVRLVIIYLVTAFLSTTLIRFLYKEDSRVTQYFESRLLTNSLYYQRRIGSNAKRSRLFDYVIRHYGSEIISVVRSSKPIFVAMALTGCGMMFDADGYARIDERIDRTNEETYWFNRNQNDAAHAAGRVPPIQKGYLNYPSYVPGRGARDNVKEGYRAVKEAIHKWWS
ncbi:MAG: hypothetical protein EOP34_11755 [Rickettsiales bacterium]|nr:MAG: hypothetical protein EOP34_11755 [Rickettsiales bacterium]